MVGVFFTIGNDYTTQVILELLGFWIQDHEKLPKKVKIDGKRRYQKVGIRDKGPKIKAICRDVFFFKCTFSTTVPVPGGCKDF